MNSRRQRKPECDDVRMLLEAVAGRAALSQEEGNMKNVKASGSSTVKKVSKIIGIIAAAGAVLAGGAALCKKLVTCKKKKAEEICETPEEEKAEWEELKEQEEASKEAEESTTEEPEADKAAEEKESEDEE